MAMAFFRNLTPASGQDAVNHGSGMTGLESIMQWLQVQRLAMPMNALNLQKMTYLRIGNFPVL